MSNYLQHHHFGSRGAGIWTGASGLGYGRPELRETHRCIAHGLGWAEVFDFGFIGQFTRRILRPATFKTTKKDLVEQQHGESLCYPSDSGRRKKNAVLGLSSRQIRRVDLNHFGLMMS